MSCQQILLALVLQKNIIIGRHLHVLKIPFIVLTLKIPQDTEKEIKYITSGTADKVALRTFRYSYATVFCFYFQCFSWFLENICSQFCPRFSRKFPLFLKKLTKPTATIVLSFRINRFFLLQLTLLPTKYFPPVSVISPSLFVTLQWR